MSIRRHPRRGVASTIAVTLLVALTVVAGTILWLYKPPVPSQPSTLYYHVETGITAPTWGDLTDCADISNPQTCAVQPALDIIFTTQSPGQMALANIEFVFLCNGTVYLQSTLPGILYIPSTNHGANFNCIGANANCLGKCGTFDPAKIFGYQIPFNRLGFFWQLSPNATYLQDGDSIVMYIHSQTQPRDVGSSKPDTDDYHGMPPWCFTLMNACTLELVYLGPPAVTVVQIPVQTLANPS